MHDLIEISAVTQIRLDFESSTELGIMDDGKCTDTLLVSNSMTDSANFFPPAICGKLSGEHSEYY